MNNRALPKIEQLRIFIRDKWLCQWCGKPVIFGPAMKLIEVELKNAGRAAPLAYYHVHWTRATAPLLDELGVVLDHKDPYAHGGATNAENLVTSCAKCNGRKSSRPLTVWNGRDRRSPIKGKYGEPEHWDGLSSYFVLLAGRNTASLTPGERDWLKVLKQFREESKPARTLIY